jgi:hypothetical protein
MRFRKPTFFRILCSAFGIFIIGSVLLCSLGIWKWEPLLIGFAPGAGGMVAYFILGWIVWKSPLWWTEPLRESLKSGDEARVPDPPR